MDVYSIMSAYYGTRCNKFPHPEILTNIIDEIDFIIIGIRDYHDSLYMQFDLVSIC